jgi:hypothetical protein
MAALYSPPGQAPQSKLRRVIADTHDALTLRKGFIFGRSQAVDFLCL